MKLAGFLLLVAGWVIAVFSIGLLRASGPRAVFVLAGLAVDLVGFALAVRSHTVLDAERE